MKDFIENISKDISNLAEVKKFTTIYEDYKPVLFDNPISNEKKDMYLRAKISNSNQRRQLDFQKNDVQTYTNPQLLTSIINLAMLILENGGFEDESACIDEIIDWCKIYGLPYEDTYFSKNYYEDHNGKAKNIKDYKSLHGEMPITGYCGFKVMEFKRRIAVLHDIFQLWYGLTFDDIRKVIKFSPILTRFDANKDLDEQILELKKFLPYRVWSEMRVEISLEYNEKKDTYNIIPYTDNLISIAYFQLAMLMANGGHENGVKFCNICNKLFEIKHGSVKTCENCKKEYHRIKTRESRERNKR